jgi:excinuclease ABC subunit A
MDDSIIIKGARHNNLKGFDLEIPLNKITVITGVSGAGKSSLAFDTLYAEGQRRYIETFSPYARQFMDRMDRPKADRIEGIPPALAIEQGDPVRTSRSTVGTVTEINDFMKMLFARAAELHCSECGRRLRRHSPQSIFQELKDTLAEGEPLAVIALVAGPTTAELRAAGLDRIWKDGKPAELEDTGKGCEILFDRLPFRRAERKRIIDSLETALRWGKGRVSIHTAAGTLRFSSSLECPYCDISFRDASPNLFSFNSPAGACPECRGFGRTIDIDPELVVPDPRRTIREGAVKPWTGIAREEFQDLLNFCSRRKIPVDVPFGELPEEDRKAIFDGDGRFYGIRGFFQWLETKRYKLHVRVFLARYRGYHTCPNCGGSRLVPEALLWRIRGRSIADFYSLPIEQAFRCLKEIDPHELDEASTLLLGEISRRLGYLIDVGLGYLSLDRQSRTLSGGEMERVSLTKAIGSSLVNTLYILDEPTVGLHPRDSQRLIGLLRRLRDQGNTIVVVEHDPEIIRAADNVVDLGPGAGESGGRLIYSGPVPGIASKRESLTGSYLSGRLGIPVPAGRRTPSGFIKLTGASEHNLKGIDLKLPLGVMTALTGVSGSGKSTLAVETLYRRLRQIKGGEAPGAGRIKSLEGYEQIADVALVDQEPIGRTPRATPATYLKALDGIRNLLAAQPLAQVRGCKPSFFSFNAAGGRCEECGGEGFEKVEMQFLSDIYLPCPKCDGKRFRDEVLEIKFRDRNIHEILLLTLSEAAEFFADHPRITRTLAPAISVGLGYLRLGQPINTLSGGEAQRLKLARELGRAKRGDGNGTLFIFDEPTIGLHPADVAGLLAAFSQLVEAGNSILVIEHNPELVKCADHVIDLGPEGGAQGGMITGEGTPEEIAALDTHTGKSLRPYLTGRAAKTAGAAAGKAARRAQSPPLISVRGAREHNLKDLNVDIPREKLVVITGVSGSGKSTLAFDLLFAEGQRRYIESLPTYIRQYLKIMDRPEIDGLTGIPPTVALEQRMSRSGRRSTVATLTEIYHYLRLLYCKLGVQHCPECGDAISAHSAEGIAGQIMSRSRGSGTLLLLAPLVAGKKGIHAELLKKMAKLGYKRAVIDGRLRDLEPTPALGRFREHDINLVVDEIKGPAGVRPAALRTALDFGRGTVHVADEKGAMATYSERLFCRRCGRGFEPLDPRLFSFNSRQGQCPRCEGIGSLEDFLPELVLPDREESIARNIEALQGRSLQRFARRLIEEIRDRAGIDPEQPVGKLTHARMNALLNGSSAAGGAGFKGIIPLLREYREYAGEDEIENLGPLLGETVCPDCRGSRLRAEARSVRLKGSGIGEVVSLSAADALNLVGSFDFRGRDADIADGIMKELLPRIKFLDRVGLGYLGLDRRGDTLSGGEAQRIRLAAQLGSNLRGICYILDEPTIGLHPRDNTVLISTLKELKERGNSILVVEHDEETIRSADHIIDLGPGAGPQGGRIIAQGTLREIRKNPESVTGAFMNGSRRPGNGSRLRLNGTTGNGQWLELRNASRHNLKGVTARIPLGTLTCVTGVSGSGKSTLVKEELFPALRKALSGRAGDNGSRLTGWQGITRAVEIDHSPIGRTPRSTPATYVGILDEIRKLFSLVPEARMRGYGPGRFSFNVRGGRCEACAGQGMIKVEMNFLPDVYIHCEECGGRRYNEETLDIRYRGKSIHEVLSMSFREGLDLFSSVSSLKKPLELLNDIGLGYLTFGQSSPSLSGGEAQRIKLAKELAWGNGRALYIMDEPTTGLHMADTERLLAVLQRLVDRGHTVVVIEHNLDIIRSADYIIDLGPEGGEAGGSIVAEGNPDEIMKLAGRSHTARFLRKHAGNARKKLQ